MGMTGAYSEIRHRRNRCALERLSSNAVMRLR
jgi:hypothetical protein